MDYERFGSQNYISHGNSYKKKEIRSDQVEMDNNSLLRLKTLGHLLERLGELVCTDILNAEI